MTINSSAGDIIDKEKAWKVLGYSLITDVIE